MGEFICLGLAFGIPVLLMFVWAFAMCNIGK